MTYRKYLALKLYEKLVRNRVISNGLNPDPEARVYTISIVRTYNGVFRYRWTVHKGERHIDDGSNDTRIFAKIAAHDVIRKDKLGRKPNVHVYEKEVQ